MSNLIDRGRTFSTRAHQRIDQRRKYSDQPYHFHLDAVASMVATVTDDAEMADGRAKFPERRRKHMNRTKAAAVVITAFLAAGCTATADKGHGTSANSTGRTTQAVSGDGGAQLADTRWTPRSLGKEAVPRNPALTLDLGRDGRVSGSDGCNRLQTVYKVDGASISISMKIAGTMMACPDQIEARARTYREALQRAARFAVSAENLSLQDATGRVLAAFVPSITALAGTRWDVVAYNNGRGGVVSVLAGTRMSANFERDGQVTGNAGCNRYFAGYQQQAQRLTIGMAATTRKFCAEPVGVMQQEALFLEVLRTSATLVLEGNRLELRKTDGALAVVLDRQPDN